jgi:serine/threonine-protein kinase RsbW
MPDLQHPMTNDKPSWRIDRTFASELVEGKRVLEEILDQLKAHHWSEHDVFSIHLSLEEAIVNAIKHGNRFDPQKEVTVKCRVSSEVFWIEISDQGTGFNPANVPDCTDDENMDVPSGRGIMLMRSFMSRVEFNDRGNQVMMEKTRSLD